MRLYEIVTSSESGLFRKKINDEVLFIAANNIPAALTVLKEGQKLSSLSEVTEGNDTMQDLTDKAETAFVTYIDYLKDSEKHYKYLITENDEQINKFVQLFKYRVVCISVNRWQKVTIIR